MKIAITSHGEDRYSALDSRFGRADYFVLYDQEEDSWDSMQNTQNLEAAHGAGIQAGQVLAETGANALITGHVGPKAFEVLQASGVDMYSFGDMHGTVQDALTAYLAGNLSGVSAPNALDGKN